MMILVVDEGGNPLLQGHDVLREYHIPHLIRLQGATFSDTRFVRWAVRTFKLPPNATLEQAIDATIDSGMRVLRLYDVPGQPGVEEETQEERYGT